MSIFAILTAALIPVLVNTLPAGQNISSPTNIAASSPVEPTPISNEIGWQSLFWSLFALALLAMTQPSVLDSASQFSSSSILFPSRCSPIVCATDTLEILIHLCVEISYGTDLRTACTRICLRRNQARFFKFDVDSELGKNIHGSRALRLRWKREADSALGAQGSTAVEGSAENASSPDLDGLKRSTIKHHPVASILTFLAALTQAIKIVGYGGVIWAQVIGLCYLISYLVSVAVQLLARDETALEPFFRLDDYIWSSKDQQKFFEGVVTWIAIISMIASSFGCSWVVFKLRENDRGNFETFDFAQNAPFLLCALIPTTIIRIIVGILILGFITGPIALLLWMAKRYIEEHPRRPRVVGIHHLDILFRLTCSAIALYISLPCLRTLLSNDGIYGGTTYAAGILCACLLTLSIVMHYLINKLGRARKETIRERAMGLHVWLFVVSIMHLVCACLYFRYVFDPTGTIKPAWTEELG